MVHSVRIFLSSPGDVAAERRQVRDLLLGLARGPFVRGRVQIDVVSWDDPYAPAQMDARFTPQEAVDRSLPTPADCDLTIVILWSRMGTPIAAKKDDGTAYRSGTEWEFESALNANRPVLLYRRTERVYIDADDALLEEQLSQKRRVDGFFDGLQNADGTFRHAYSRYSTIDDLLTRVRQDVEAYFNQLLSEVRVPAADHRINSHRRDVDTDQPLGAPVRPAMMPAGGATFDVPKLSPWSSVASQTTHFFLADAGFAEGSDIAVIACVIVDDIDAFRRKWQADIASMLEDPQLRAVPTIVEAVRRQRFAYRDAEPAIREQIARVLQALLFEAFVGFTRRGASLEDKYRTLLRAVVFDRLRAYRTREVAIALAMTHRSHRSQASSVIHSIWNEVHSLHADAGENAPRISDAEWASPGPTVAAYIAEIVRERLEHGRSARTFDLVHPNKLRVIYDLETGRYYTKSDPFDG